jgi:hypothetical protein
VSTPLTVLRAGGQGASRNGGELRKERWMSESDIDAQMERETAIAGLENAARRYAAAFLAVSGGDGDQEQLLVARQRLAAAACAYVAGGGQPWADEERRG